MEIMEPSDIELSSIDKLFEYERQSRFIDSLGLDDLKKFSKMYLRLYLKQQETILSLSNINA
jgi:hypothetical protein